MEPQTGGLRGCVGNAWPQTWEIILRRSGPSCTPHGPIGGRIRSRPTESPKGFSASGSDLTGRASRQVSRYFVAALLL